MVLRRHLNTIQSEEFISSSKALQDGRTFEKESKTAKFAHEGLSHAPLRMR